MSGVDAADIPVLKKAVEHGPRREDGVFSVSCERQAAAVLQQESVESLSLVLELDGKERHTQAAPQDEGFLSRLLPECLLQTCHLWWL